MTPTTRSILSFRRREEETIKRLISSERTAPGAKRSFEQKLRRNQREQQALLEALLEGGKR